MKVRSKWLVEVAKLVALSVFFLVVQHQIFTMRSEVNGASGQVALALSHYQGEVEQTRSELIGAVESSQRRLHDIQEGLRISARYLTEQKESIAEFMTSRDQAVFESIGDEFSRYQGQMERVLSNTVGYDERLRDVEARVERALKHDSLRLQRSMLSPIARLKGDGTVGSGVVISSRPRLGVPGEASDEDAGGEPGYSTFLLTACHVVVEVLGEDFPRGTLDSVYVIEPGKSGSYSAHSARVEIYDEVRDLALLRLASTEPIRHVARPITRERFSTILLFSEIYAVGCPLGNNPLPSYGEISSQEKFVGTQKFWMINAPTFFGNSGGGVFLAETGELIGISSMIYTYGKTKPVVVPHMGLFVPIDQISTWLESEGYGWVLADSWAPSIVSNPPEASGATASVSAGSVEGAPSGTAARVAAE